MADGKKVKGPLDPSKTFFEQGSLVWCTDSKNVWVPAEGKKKQQ